MRTTLLGSLLDAARHNLARGAERVALFESGRVYLPADGRSGRDGLRRPATSRRAAGAVRRAAPDRLRSRSAPLAPASWRGGGEPADFFALKGVLEALAGAARRRARLRARRASRSCTRAARPRCSIGGAAAGWIGELHPLVCRAWDLDGRRRLRGRPGAPGRRLAGRRGDLRGRDHLPGRLPGPRRRRPPRRSAAEVRAAVLAGGGELLRAAEVFDLYEGEQVGEGRKSLALRLEFRAADRTLTDEEVAEPARRDRGRARRDRGDAA